MGGICAPSQAKNTVADPAARVISNDKALPTSTAKTLETPNADGMVNEIKTIEKKDAPLVVEGEAKPEAEAVVEI